MAVFLSILILLVSKMHLYIFIIPGILMQMLRIIDEVSSGSHRPQLVLPLNEITTLGNHKPNFSKEVSLKSKDSFKTQNSNAYISMNLTLVSSSIQKISIN